MKVNILDPKPTEFRGLLPAPNVTESEDIRQQILATPRSEQGLTDGPLEVCASYRGHSLYLNNGAFVYRLNPPGHVNGYACGPNGTEDCYVSYEGKWYTCLANFS
jgi:hypothetical protein